MRTIPLTQGKVALVDDTDYEWLSQWKWYANGHGENLYAVRKTASVAGGRQSYRMHRVIMGSSADGLEVDHINGDRLDNRRENLRVATRRQNSANRKLHATSTSGFRGVFWCTTKRRWRAAIRDGHRRIFLGTFDNKIAAAIAYNIAAVQMRGEFARLNDVFSGKGAPTEEL